MTGAATRLAARTWLCGTLVSLAPCIALGAEISPGERDAVLRDTGRACNEQMPEEIRQRAGAAAVLNFCSCYANEVARTITEEQLHAPVVGPGSATAIARYAETARNARGACDNQFFLTTEATANSESQR